MDRRRKEIHVRKQKGSLYSQFTGTFALMCSLMCYRYTIGLMLQERGERERERERERG